MIPKNKIISIICNSNLTIFYSKVPIKTLKLFRIIWLNTCNELSFRKEKIADRRLLGSKICLNVGISNNPTNKPT